MIKTEKANKRTDKGFLYLGYNNEQVNYAAHATMSAALAKSCIPEAAAALVTTEYDLPYAGECGLDPREIFDHIYLTDPTWEDQYRVYRDGEQNKDKLPYRNVNRVNAYDLTPFEETILIDSDYIIQSDVLNHCWENTEPLMMNKDAVTVTGDRLDLGERRLSDKGIKMYWATVVYFRKDPVAEAFFKINKHIADNYRYFSKLYHFPNSLFRNDYVFSVGAHMLNDFNETRILPPLPNESLITSLDKDLIIDVTQDHIKFFSYQNEVKEHYQATHLVPAKIYNDVHIMNKFALSKFEEKFVGRL